jgi:hypothetical protein
MFTVHVLYPTLYPTVTERCNVHVYLYGLRVLKSLTSK